MEREKEMTTAMTKAQLMEAFNKYDIESIVVDRQEIVNGEPVTRQHTLL